MKKQIKNKMNTRMISLNRSEAAQVFDLGSVELSSEQLASFVGGEFSSNELARAVAIDPGGRAIHQRSRKAALTKRSQKVSGSRVLGALSGWRRQVHDTRGQSGQTAQGLRRIQITDQRQDTLRTQNILALRTGGQGQHTQAPWPQACHTQPHVATTHNQQAFATKACRQRAQRALV